MGETDLIVFAGRAGDRNDRAMSGSVKLGGLLARELGLEPTTVGRPEAVLATRFDVELEAARAQLADVAGVLDRSMAGGRFPVTVIGRCAAGLATLPVVARHHPGVRVVWLDAHGDGNTPSTSAGGYLGGMVLTGAAGLWDTGLGAGLALEDVVLVGARDLDEAERDLLHARGVTLLPPGPGLARRLGEEIGSEPVYVHVDCDVLDAGLVSSEYQVPDGLGFEDLREVAAVLVGRRVVGLEIAEFEVAWPDGSECDVAPLIDALMPILRRP